MYVKFHQNIPYGSRDKTSFTFSEFGPRQSLDKWKMAFGNILDYVLSVSMRMQTFIKIFPMVQELFTFFRIWTSAKPRPMINGIWQSIRLGFVYINVFAKFYQNGSRVMGSFHFFTIWTLGLDLSKTSTNGKLYCAIPWARSYHYRCVCEISSKYSRNFKI